MRGTSGTSQQLTAVAITKPAQPAAATQPTNAYNPRHPERTLLYRTVAEHFETWLELASAGQFDGQ